MGSVAIFLPGIGTPIKTPVIVLTIMMKRPSLNENQKLFDHGKSPAKVQTKTAATVITRAE